MNQYSVVKRQVTRFYRKNLKFTFWMVAVNALWVYVCMEAILLGLGL